MADPTAIIPISSLSPTLQNYQEKAVRAVVTLIWPYSSSTRQCALLLADPDFRLRRRKGQVRIQLIGTCAEHVAQSGIGIGDEVNLNLEGAEWLKDDGSIQTPGKSVEWELKFRHRLKLQIRRDSQPLTELDIESGSPQPAEPTALPNPKTRAISNRSEHWSSPAFVRSRLSGSSLDLLDSERANKRRRTSWRDSREWRLVEGNPSPMKRDALLADEDDSLFGMENDAKIHHIQAAPDSPLQKRSKFASKNRTEDQVVEQLDEQDLQSATIQKERRSSEGPIDFNISKATSGVTPPPPEEHTVQMRPAMEQTPRADAVAEYEELAEAQQDERSQIEQLPDSLMEDFSETSTEEDIDDDQDEEEQTEEDTSEDDYEEVHGRFGRSMRFTRHYSDSKSDESDGEEDQNEVSADDIEDDWSDSEDSLVPNDTAAAGPTGKELGNSPIVIDLLDDSDEDGEGEEADEEEESDPGDARRLQADPQSLSLDHLSEVQHESVKYPSIPDLDAVTPDFLSTDAPLPPAEVVHGAEASATAPAHPGSFPLVSPYPTEDMHTFDYYSDPYVLQHGVPEFAPFGVGETSGAFHDYNLAEDQRELEMPGFNDETYGIESQPLNFDDASAMDGDDVEIEHQDDGHETETSESTESYQTDSTGFGQDPSSPQSAFFRYDGAGGDLPISSRHERRQMAGNNTPNKPPTVLERTVPQHRGTPKRHSRNHGLETFPETQSPVTQAAPSVPGLDQSAEEKVLAETTIASTSSTSISDADADIMDHDMASESHLDSRPLGTFEKEEETAPLQDAVTEASPLGGAVKPPFPTTQTTIIDLGSDDIEDDDSGKAPIPVSEHIDFPPPAQPYANSPTQQEADAHRLGGRNEHLYEVDTAIDEKQEWHEKLPAADDEEAEDSSSDMDSLPDLSIISSQKPRRTQEEQPNQTEPMSSLTGVQKSLEGVSRVKDSEESSLNSDASLSIRINSDGGDTIIAPSPVADVPSTPNLELAKETGNDRSRTWKNQGRNPLLAGALNPPSKSPIRPMLARTRDLETRSSPMSPNSNTSMSSLARLPDVTSSTAPASESRPEIIDQERTPMDPIQGLPEIRQLQKTPTFSSEHLQNDQATVPFQPTPGIPEVVDLSMMSSSSLQNPATPIGPRSPVRDSWEDHELLFPPPPVVQETLEAEFLNLPASELSHTEPDDIHGDKDVHEASHENDRRSVFESPLAPIRQEFQHQSDQAATSPFTPPLAEHYEIQSPVMYPQLPHSPVVGASFEAQQHGSFSLGLAGATHSNTLGPLTPEPTQHSQLHLEPSQESYQPAQHISVPPLTPQLTQPSQDLINHASISFKSMASETEAPAVTQEQQQDYYQQHKHLGKENINVQSETRVEPTNSKPKPRRSAIGTVGEVPRILSPWFAPSNGVKQPDNFPMKTGSLSDQVVSPTRHLRSHSRQKSKEETSQALSQLNSIGSHRGLRTSLSYYTPLAAVDAHLNSQSPSLDVLALCLTTNKPAARASGGPRDYFTSFFITDSSVYPQRRNVQAFRPWKAALPETQPGDVILLREVNVRGYQTKKSESRVGLMGINGSSWCVWKFDEEAGPIQPVWAQKHDAGTKDGRIEVRGPPVEIEDGEWNEARRLRKWWLDEVEKVNGSDNTSLLHENQEVSELQI